MSDSGTNSEGGSVFWVAATLATVGLLYLVTRGGKGGPKSKRRSASDDGSDSHDWDDEEAAAPRQSEKEQRKAKVKAKTEKTVAAVDAKAAAMESEADDVIAKATERRNAAIEADAKVDTDFKDSKRADFKEELKEAPIKAVLGEVSVFDQTDGDTVYADVARIMVATEAHGEHGDIIREEGEKILAAIEQKAEAEALKEVSKKLSDAEGYESTKQQLEAIQKKTAAEAKETLAVYKKISHSIRSAATGSDQKSIKASKEKSAQLKAKVEGQKKQLQQLKKMLEDDAKDTAAEKKKVAASARTYSDDSDDGFGDTSDDEPAARNEPTPAAVEEREEKAPEVNEPEPPADSKKDDTRDFLDKMIDGGMGDH